MALNSTMRAGAARWLRWTIYLFVATTTLSGLAGVLFLVGTLLFPFVPFILFPVLVGLGGVPSARSLDTRQPVSRRSRVGTAVANR